MQKIDCIVLSVNIVPFTKVFLVLRMPQNNKDITRTALRKQSKNNNRIDAALRGQLDGCTYGVVIKSLGNRQFRIVDTKRIESLALIAHKMTWVNVGDIVLLNVRDYETRAATDRNVYDVLAIFTKKDATRLVKDGKMPEWMLKYGPSGCDDKIPAADASDDDEIFDHGADDATNSDEEEDDDDAAENKVDKRNKVSKRGTQLPTVSDDFNIDDI